MTTVPIWHGHIDEQGRFGLLEGEKPRRQAYFRTLKGNDVEIIVRKRRRPRSLNMNAYLHAVPFPILADYFGDSIEEVKRDLMGECFGWRFNEKLGRHTPVKPHTSDMSVEESKFFLDWLIPWAMTKHGVDIPLPGEVAA